MRVKLKDVKTVGDCGPKFGVSSENVSHIKCEPLEMKQADTKEKPMENSMSVSAPSFSSCQVSLSPSNAVDSAFIRFFFLPAAF